MRYSADHKAATRSRLLKQAGALAKREGFANTGVDALATAAGLTAGAFYAHFGSKSAMLQALVEQELEASLHLFDREQGRDDPAALLAAYLSLAHVEHPEAGCCLPALSAEIARAEEPVRATFEQAVLKIHARLQELLGGDRDQAWALLAQAVGGVLLARAMNSKGARKAVLEGLRGSMRQAPGAAGAGGRDGGERGGS